jgi:hypothetical protein
MSRKNRTRKNIAMDDRTQAKGPSLLHPTNPKGRFALEGLEPRVMLSVDLLFNAAPPVEPENLLAPVQETYPLETAQVIESGLPETLATLESTPNDPAGIDDLFAGLTGEELVAGTQPDHSATETLLDFRTQGAMAETVILSGNQIFIGETTTNLPIGANLHLKADAIRITGALDFTGDVELEADTIIVEASITAKNLTLTADDLDIRADIQGLDGGTLVLQPLTDTAGIGIADQAETNRFNLGIDELDHIKGDFDRLVIGRADGRHVVEIGNYTFRQAVTFRAPLLGGAFDVLGVIQTTADPLLDEQTPIEFIGSGHTQTRYTDTITTGDAIAIYDSLAVAVHSSGVMGNGAVYLDTTNNGGSASGQNILITGQVDGVVSTSADYNSMNVRILADVASGAAYAECLPDPLLDPIYRLTVHVKSDGSSTTAEVAAAIGNVYNFFNVGRTGTITSVGSTTLNFSSKTSGGSSSSLANGSFDLAGNTITFKAGVPAVAAAFNGAGVQIVADSFTAAGSAAYSAADNKLLVHVQSGITTTAHISAAIGSVFNFFNVAGGDGSIVTLSKTYAAITSGGIDGTAKATGTFALSGDTITVTASSNGSAYNGVNVVIVADATAPLTPLTVAYDSVNKVITVHVRNNGSSTTGDVANAIDTLAEFVATAGGGSNNVALTLDYAAVISGGDVQTPASGSFVIADDTISFNAGRTIDGTAFNGLGVAVQLDAAAAGRNWAEYNAVNRTLIVHLLAGSTMADAAATLGTLFNVFEVAGGSATAATAGVFAGITSGGDVNYAASGSFTLAGDTITFKAGRVGEALYLNAGTGGDIVIQSSVGVSAALQNVYIVKARNVIFNGQIVLSGDLVQAAGTGSSTFDLNVTANDDINLATNGSIEFKGALKATTGDVTLKVNSADSITTGLISVVKDTQAGGNVTITDAKTVQFGLAVTATGKITQSAGTQITRFDGQVSAHDMDVNANQQIIFSSGLNISAGPTYLTSDEIAFNGGANTIIGAGVLTMKPISASKSINVGSPVGVTSVLDLSDTDLAALRDGFSQINIGYAGTAANTIVIGSSTFKDPLAVYGGTVLVNGDLIGDTSVDITARSADPAIDQAAQTRSCCPQSGNNGRRCNTDR